MYYYAYIHPETGVCSGIEEYEEQFESPYYVLIDSYDESLYLRKKYLNGTWVDATPIEAQVTDAKHLGINEIWLDDKIYGMEDDIATKANATHTHSEYSPSTHTHSGYATTTIATASANGLMSATDKAKFDGMVLATVSEVETYLSI